MPIQVDQLVDLGKRDALFVYDYRRYQIDTIRFARQAAKQGARIVLFTDRWASPIAEFASVTLMAPVDTVSPYDTMGTCRRPDGSTDCRPHCAPRQPIAQPHRTHGGTASQLRHYRRRLQHIGQRHKMTVRLKGRRNTIGGQI